MPSRPTPNPKRRKRDAAEKAAYNLAVALEYHAEEILLFPCDLRVSFDNNQAERDLRIAKLQRKIPGCFRTATSLGSGATSRRVASTGLNPVDLLIQLFLGHSWTIPAGI